MNRDVNMRRLIIYTLVFLASMAACEQAEPIEPLVHSSEAQNIGTNQATLVGDLRRMGARSDWEYGFVWSAGPGTNISNGTQILLGNRNTTGIFSALIEDLSPQSTYYYKAFVADPGFSNVYYGGEFNFTTLP